MMTQVNKYNLNKTLHDMELSPLKCMLFTMSPNMVRKIETAKTQNTNVFETVLPGGNDLLKDASW